MPFENDTFAAFVFDLDGTLIDSRPAIEQAAQQAIASVLPALQGRCVADAIGPPVRVMFQRSLGITDALTLDSLVSAFRQAYDTEACLQTPAYAGAAEVLAQIAARGATSYVLTNKPWAPTCRILAHLGLDRHLREVVTPDSPTAPFTSKAEALRSLLHRHALAAPSALMVGDSPDDAEAAASCGVAFAAALYGYGGLHAADHLKNWLIIGCPQDILLHLS